MNRLQKKCVLATAGFHLLLLTILLVGPAFFNQEPKPDNTKLLDVIPANLIDAAFSSGVRGATPPPPAPIVNPPPPLPPPPTPAVQPTPQPPPKPVVKPEPTVMDRVKEIFKPAPKPEPVKPEPAKTETQPHKIQPNLTPAKNPPPTSKPDNSRNNAAAINNAIRSLRNNLKPGTVIEMPGDSSVAYANYASVVKSVYDAAWILPDSVAKDENVTVKVTIASDGSVISSRILEQSGDAPVDASVQKALDRVTFVAPFPEGSSDKQRTYTINFNPQIKKSE